MPQPQAVPSGPSRSAPIWLLALLTLSGTIAAHMFGPALPDAAVSLGVSAGQMQQAIGIYVLGLAVGQLFFGPLSDAFGRRPTLMVGLGVYTLGGLAVAVAPDLGTLLAGRMLQALGASAGLALGRAMTRDTATPETVVSRLAFLSMLAVLGPGLAPLVGSAVTSLWHWRGIFVVLSVGGAVTLWLSWRILPETVTVAKRFDPIGLLKDCATLYAMPRFTGFAVGGGCAAFSGYAFIATAPFIFIQQLGESVYIAGLYTGLAISCTSLGSLITGRLARRVNPRTLLYAGNFMNLASIGTLLVIVVNDRLSSMAVLVAMGIYTIGSGISTPVALGKALNINPRLTGSAAGLFGSTQFLAGSICSTLAGLGSNPALSMTLVMTGAVLISHACYRLGLWAEARASASS